MTAAVIYIDAELTHPVINGEWHRLKFSEIPEPGGAVTMYCGVSGAVEFQPIHARRDRLIPRQCESCDRLYRREQGIPLLQDRLRVR